MRNNVTTGDVLDSSIWGRGTFLVLLACATATATAATACDPLSPAFEDDGPELVATSPFAVAREPLQAAVAAFPCDNIHAAQIAQEEGLPDCNATRMTGLIGRTSGGPGATFARARWNLDCLDMTANECAAQHYDHPERTVQANGGDMRLIFPDTAERCADGTRPAYYFAPGSGSGAARWIVYLNGSSGKCSARVDRAAGVVVPIGESCYETYSLGLAQSSFLLKEAQNDDGILSSNSAQNPFYNWNRVHIVSCSNDQYQGQRIQQDVVIRGRHTAALYSRGHLIVKDVLLDLARSANLTAADRVVLNGASGGAAGLIMTLDALAAHVRTLLQSHPEAPIVGLIDSRGAESSIENSESQFDDLNDTCSSIFDADCDPLDFDIPPAGTDLAGFAFDTTAYQPYSAAFPTRGGTYEKFASWGSALDEECQAVHGTNAPECLDANHVLFNHLRTPVFIAASISDTNQWNNPIEFLGENQADVTWQALDCGGPNPGARYIDHSRHQLESYVLNRDNACGGADGESRHSAQFGVWAPQLWEHILSHDRCKFSQLTLAGVTLADAFSRWLAGNSVTLIDGYQGSATGTECGTPAPDCTP